ncbi:MAG: DUF2335 domain-containing protein [Chloroflexota bacterium]|nr:DUF2335 domain-containing protein [Chloroflexota bacterium]
MDEENEQSGDGDPAAADIEQRRESTSGSEIAGNQPQVIVEQSQAVSYQGPIPHPDAFAEYEKTLPGAADRILSMAETQQAHRLRLEEQMVAVDARQSMGGLIAGFVVALAVLALAGVFAWLEMPVPAVVTALVHLAALVGVFVYGTRSRRDEREKQSAVSQPPSADASESGSAAS